MIPASAPDIGGLKSTRRALTGSTTKTPTAASNKTRVISADVNQVDGTGLVWTYLEEDSEEVAIGSVLIAGDEAEPFQARVIDVVRGTGGRPVARLEGDLRLAHRVVPPAKTELAKEPLVHRVGIRPNK
ncbi:MAG: hypothetical protein HYX32_09280 [Actinobacteria bacterium]|nr:hypothetical protein [Actinomycetota bacterium]